MSAQQPRRVVDELLAEAGLAHDDALARALEGIRALRPASAPEPSGELAALFADASTTVPAIPQDRPAAVVQPLRPRTVKRHRGAMISAIVVAGMGLGATGVAALGGDPFGWLVPDPPAAVSGQPAAATPSPAIEPLEAAPGDGRTADDGVLPPWLPGSTAAGGARGAQPTKPAKAGGQQGLLGGATASGREPAKDAAGGLAAAERAASDAAGGAGSGAEAGASDPGNAEAGATGEGSAGGASEPGEVGIDSGAAAAQGTPEAPDSLSTLRELARVSRGEVPGGQAQSEGQGKGSGR